jgi:signal transduction histidine kinase
MNGEVKRFPDAVVDGTVFMRSAARPATERIHRRFLRPDKKRNISEHDLRAQEQRKERERIARGLHDTLLQGFLGASVLLSNAVDQMPADLPSKPSLNRVLSLMHRVLDEGRTVLQGLRSPGEASMCVEQALTNLLDEFALAGTKFRVVVTGQPKVLEPAIQEEIYMIGREALVNALRHSNATSIEAEVEYLPRRLRVVVRDNGCGIEPQILKSGRDSHWGLLGMRERAREIGAKIQIWSRKGSGTEVEISVPVNVAGQACA